MCETFEEGYLNWGWEGKELRVSRAERVNQAVRAKGRFGVPRVELATKCHMHLSQVWGGVCQSLFDLEFK